MKFLSKLLRADDVSNTTAASSVGLRWFFALNEESPGFWEYANLVQVAVHSARKHTRLRPACIYEGAENALTLWLRDAGVPVFHRRTALHGWVPDLMPIARGAYLRLEIPALCREQGWDDQFVLYTDCDVMFAGDPEPALRALRPKFFAVAPEHDRADWVRFNSGVMLMNVPALAAELPAIWETVRAHLPETIRPPYDQAALQRHFAGRIDRLPLELNWKPYWGENAAAAVVHFHGPKPAQRYLVLNQRVPSDLAALATPAYYAFARRWEDELHAAIAATPWRREVTQAGVRPGWEGFSSATGLGEPVVARPEVLQPEVRWGLFPQTELRFTAEPDARYRFETVFQCDHPGQATTIACDDRELTHVALARVGDTYTVALDLDVAPGEHRLVFFYSRELKQPLDPQRLGVLFRALRVRRVEEPGSANVPHPTSSLPLRTPAG